MFDVLFGWRKASKCKKLIKRIQCRLKLLKNKRCSIVRQLREDVAQLVKIGYEDIAFNRAEHLFRDETLVAVYELLDSFCEFITIHLPYIRRHKDCPNDINEAVSSLIFASARCGDLPELRGIRKLFGERYGRSFEMTALELLPGNLVNLQVKEKLSIMSVPDEVKFRLVEEIAREYYLQTEVFALEYTSMVQQQGKVQGLQLPSPRRSDVFPNDVSKSSSNMEVKSIFVDSASGRTDKNLPFDSRLHFDTISDSTSPPVQQSSPDVQDFPQYKKAETVLQTPVAQGSRESQKIGRAYTTSPRCKEEQKPVTSSPESLPQLPEEMIVYVDDIQEIQSPITEEGSSQDQRMFKFKSSPVPRNGKDFCHFESGDESETGNERRPSRSCRHGIDTVKKRHRRRSISREHRSVSEKDIDSLIYYYDKPSKRDSIHKQASAYSPSKDHRHSQKREKQCTPNHQCFHFDEDCSLNHPCYRCPDDSRDNHKVPPQKPNSRNTIPQGHFQDVAAESDTEMEWYTFHDKPRRRSCEFGEMRMSGNTREFDVASNGSTPSTANSPLIRKQGKPPYLRAMTMPQERSKDGQTDNCLRSKSFPIQSPNHVHPKLPDYDDIAEKFMALKKQNLKNRCH
ncbi:hypothetical protein Tsubulata_024315 [Turnera subulata]|uniref:IST1-like protein n=1 Tax=Turnera subulata TaxID=218843 RepID=A0A9Q0F6R7_9ROSI|nr:hypothetical protein Tsubulata_024315 [Turnera subulata]